MFGYPSRGYAPAAAGPRRLLANPPLSLTPPMPRRRASLVSHHVEDVSRALLEQHQALIRDQVQGRHGVYALYRGRELYYVGLASDLRSRLTQHLRDTHADGWDRFSLYLTIENGHMRELEALVMRISRPRGNKQRGKFANSEDLRHALERRYRDKQEAERSELFGARAARAGRGVAKRSARRASTGAPPLAPFASQVREIRARYKGREIRATVESDGRIRLGRHLHRSPSGAAESVVNRPCSGWTFWKWRGSEGEWVPLEALRSRQ